MSAPARLFSAGTRRAIHSSARRLAEPAPPAVNAQGVVSEVPVQKPVGGFRWVPRTETDLLSCDADASSSDSTV
jgi:hypothetical protein